MNSQRVSGFHRGVRKIFSVRAVAWLLAHTAHLIDGFLMSVSNGRYSAAGLVAGVPVIRLTTIGAKSGQFRTVPLLGIPAGENIILIGSNWGQGHHPAWYYNVRANPEVQVESNGRTAAYLAHEANGEAYQEFWQIAASIYPGYEAYKKWTNGRKIPVLVLARKN